jgi:hypothetical protein
MKHLLRNRFASALCCAALGAGAIPAPASAAELLGRAVLQAETFAAGPTSGQFTAGGNGIATPFIDKQPVQGFSAILPGPRKGTYYVMMDNGFGSKPSSPDLLLRVFAVKANFRTGTVTPVNRYTGEALASFTAESFFTLSDPKKRLPFAIVADADNYPGTPASVDGPIPVDAAIKKGRLLTGWDFDIESIRRSADGTFWFGDEFGPFLIHTDKDGRVIDAPVALPNFHSFATTLGGDRINPYVQSPSNPLLASADDANIPNSGGFEGMALNASGTRLYALLEKAINGDAQRNRLWIHEFNPFTKKYTGKTFAYPLESNSNAIGDFTALSDKEYVVIERDSGQGDASNPNFPAPAKFKKIYRVDLTDVDADGTLVKHEVVDLLNIYDPRDIVADGKLNTQFTFPFTTIEDVLVLDNNTLLVVNDNNFPFSSGREFNAADNNEFIVIHTAPLLDDGKPCKWNFGWKRCDRND